MKPKLVVNTGSMFSGKSTELLRQGERHILAGHSVVFIKPLIDDRYSKDEIVNHNGQKIKAININNPTEILTNVEIINSDVILIDEIQFFDDISLKNVIDNLLKSNYIVYCSGLDMDFKGEPFKITSILMAMADEVNKFRAVCSICGDDANFSYKTNGSDKQIELGEKDIYQPLCRKCFYKKLKNL